MKRLSVLCGLGLLGWAAACGSDDIAQFSAEKKDEVRIVRSVRNTVEREKTQKLLPKRMGKAEKQRALELRKNQPMTIATYNSAPTGSVRVPAEYEAMEGVLIRVPNDSSLDEFFGNMIKGAVESGATPHLIYTSTRDRSNIINYTLTPKGVSATQVKWVSSASDAFWSRDYGPWHVYVNNKRAIVDMRYYPTRPYDDNIPLLLGNLWNEDVYKAGLYVEGGNFMTDGKGTCWTTSGIYDFNNISSTQLKTLYRQYLGCQKVYTPNPIYGEGTTHIDMLAKIVNDNTVLVSQSRAEWGASSSEINSLESAASSFTNSTNVSGQSFKVVRLPMVFDGAGDYRTYYTYTNATVLNKTVLVPQYNLSFDEQALQIYRDNMPGYNVVGVYGAEYVIPMGGSVHCTTMQIPTLTSGAVSPTPTPNTSAASTLTTETETGSVGKGKWQLFYYTAGTGTFKASITGTGDVDLYVWKNVDANKLTTGNYACRPYLDGSTENCNLSGPGTITVGLNGYETSNTYNLTVQYNKP